MNTLPPPGPQLRINEKVGMLAMRVNHKASSLIFRGKHCCTMQGAFVKTNSASLTSRWCLTIAAPTRLAAVVHNRTLQPHDFIVVPRTRIRGHIVAVAAKIRGRGPVASGLDASGVAIDATRAREAGD